MTGTRGREGRKEGKKKCPIKWAYVTAELTAQSADRATDVTAIRTDHFLMRRDRSNILRKGQYAVMQRGAAALDLADRQQEPILNKDLIDKKGVGTGVVQLKQTHSAGRNKDAHWSEPDVSQQLLELDEDTSVFGIQPAVAAKGAKTGCNSHIT